MQWVRKRDDVFAQWHLLADSRAVLNGRVALRPVACGQTVGLEDDPELEQVYDESVIGNRCPSCQGVALRGGTT